MILTVCRQWTEHLVFVCLVQRSTQGLSLIKWSSLHTSPRTPKHSGAVVLMFFWSTNTHFRNRCHRQQDSRLSIHTASGFIDSEGGRVCSYKQHTGVLLKQTPQTLHKPKSALQSGCLYKMHLRGASVRTMTCGLSDSMLMQIYTHRGTSFTLLCNRRHN